MWTVADKRFSHGKLCLTILEGLLPGVCVAVDASDVLLAPGPWGSFSASAASQRPNLCVFRSVLAGSPLTKNRCPLLGDIWAIFFKLFTLRFLFVLEHLSFGCQTYP